MALFCNILWLVVVVKLVCVCVCRCMHIGFKSAVFFLVNFGGCWLGYD